MKEIIGFGSVGTNDGSSVKPGKNMKRWDGTNDSETSSWDNHFCNPDKTSNEGLRLCKVDWISSTHSR